MGGDDVYFGANVGAYDQVQGGEGNDKIFGGNYFAKNEDGNLQTGQNYFGDAGDDLIDLGDFNGINSADGGNGNDKIIGGHHLIA